MIRRFLMWLSARLPAKQIGREAPYVEWYHVWTFEGVRLRFAGLVLQLPLPAFRMQLHRFLRSDPDGLHDHPWGWARSIVLSGWYQEERRDRTRVRKAGNTYGMTGDTFHRVHLPLGSREVWTLFFHGPYVKHWGFLQPVPRAAMSAELPTWTERRGGFWTYVSRPRHFARFDDWHKTAPKGRELRATRDQAGEAPFSSIEVDQAERRLDREAP